MKKIALVVLSLVLLLSLSACSSEKGPAESTAPPETEGPTIPSRCEHAYVESITEDATCTNEGTKTFTCSTCGDSYTESIEKAAHAYIDATCTAPKTCELCGETEGEALPHTFKDATCSAPKTCSDCGTTEGAALGHSYKNATCTTAKTCSVCGATSGAALGHKYENEGCTGEKTCSVCGDAKQNSHSWKDATCAEPKTCSVCGETEGEALGHSWKDATCLAPKTCSVCGETEGTASEVHAWNDATCTSPKTCSVCGETEGEALGHTLTATCTRCGEASAAYADLLAFGWVYDYLYEDTNTKTYEFSSFAFNEDGNASYLLECYATAETLGKSEDQTTEDWESYWYETDGRLQYHIIDETKYYLYDDFYFYDVPYTTKDTTVTVDFSKYYSNALVTLALTADNNLAISSVTDDFIFVVLGNVYYPDCVSHTFKDATCIAPKICWLCGKTEGEPLGHAWADATCTSPKTCSVCGETEGEALGHNFVDGTCTGCDTQYAELVGTKWVWSFRHLGPDETYWSFGLPSLLFEADGKAHYAIDDYQPVEYAALYRGMTIAEFKEFVPDGQFVMVDGIEYYYLGRTALEMTYTESNGTVTVNFVDVESMGNAPFAVMHRTGYTEYTVTEGDYVIDGSTVIPIGKYHTFADATCNEPKTCLACGATEGEPLDHDFANGLCTACGKKHPDFVNLTDCTWSFTKAYYRDSLDQVLTLSKTGYTFDKNGTVATFECATHYSVENAARKHGVSVEAWKMANGLNFGPLYLIDGNEYYNAEIHIDLEAYTEENGIVTTSYTTLNDQGEYCRGTIVLQRTGPAEYTVITLAGDECPYLSVGDKFTPHQDPYGGYVCNTGENEEGMISELYCYFEMDGIAYFEFKTGENLEAVAEKTGMTVEEIKERWHDGIITIGGKEYLHQGMGEGTICFSKEDGIVNLFFPYADIDEPLVLQKTADKEYTVVSVPAQLSEVYAFNIPVGAKFISH